MSQPKFAPITAGLLARKGGAMPSALMPLAMVQRDAPMKVEAVVPPCSAAAAAPVEPPREQEAHPKRLFVPLSHAGHERLAIASVKTGLTRHQIVRDALDLYCEQLSHDIGETCLCIARKGTCEASCSAASGIS